MNNKGIIDRLSTDISESFTEATKRAKTSLFVQQFLAGLPAELDESTTVIVYSTSVYFETSKREDLEVLLTLSPAGKYWTKEPGYGSDHSL